MSRWLIMGATSAIAEATARELARAGDALLLVGRDSQRLAAIAADLRVRGASSAETYLLDAQDFAAFPALMGQAFEGGQDLDGALIAHGSLPDQSACESSVAPMLQAFSINALSVMALATLLATRFEARGRGAIVVISSVAGDRGRGSNYVYGASKAAVSAFMSGLRQRLHSKGVRVVTVKPGLVDTPMTTAFPKSVLWASPRRVGRVIAKVMRRGTSQVYVPWFWRPIMMLIRALPEPVFVRVRL